MEEEDQPEMAALLELALLSAIIWKTENFQGWIYRLKYFPRRYFKYPPPLLLPLEGPEICLHDRFIPVENFDKHFPLISSY